jgi:hypothetical protein
MRRSLAALLLVLVACSSSASSSPTSAPAAAEPDPAPSATDPAPPAPPPAPTSDACGVLPKSKCSPASQGSIVRGTVTFDPAHFAGKPKPTLRVFLHHQIVVKDSEAKQGGHPHAWASSTDVDVTTGRATFAMDLCDFGTAMYSEENCGYELVALLDEDGSHDPDANGELALMPRKGELVKLVPLEISCHAPAQCLSITADCQDGDACTTITPLDTKACKCKPDACPSDNTVCSK